MQKRGRLPAAVQAALVGTALVFSLHTTGRAVRWQSLVLSGAALVQDPAAALAAADALCAERTDRQPVPAAAAPDGFSDADAAPTPQPTPFSSSPTPQPSPAWDGVLPEGCVAVEEEFFAQQTGEGYVACGAGSLKNCTALTDAEVAGVVAEGMPFSLEKNSSEPQILIMHTHATETYNLQSPYYAAADWGARTTDTSLNMCAVGAAMAEELNAAGYCTLHDETLHDYPSYNGSYEASNATVRRYLEEYPSIKVVLDVHRDAIERDGTRIKPLTELEGGDTAQVMIICGCDQGGNLPNFRQNLRFAAAWEEAMEAAWPGLTRPVLFDYRYYNQDLTTGSLLLEVGGHANTLDEALRAGRYAARALVQLFDAG